MLLAAVMLTDKPVTRTLILSLTLLFFVLIKGPFYSFLDTEKPGNRNVEILGLPMTVIGNVVKQDPDALDNEILEFAWQIASPEDWQTWYSVGNFNSLKFTEFCNTQPIEEAGTAKVLSYMFRCFRVSPARSLEGLIGLTMMVYAVSGPVIWEPAIFPPSLYALLNNSIVRYMSLYVGIPTMICIAVSLSHCRLTKRRDWQRLFVLFALLIHNWGTMLLLTGPDFRFFYMTYPVSAGIVFVMQNERKQRDY